MDIIRVTHHGSNSPMGSGFTVKNLRTGEKPKVPFLLAEKASTLQEEA